MVKKIISEQNSPKEDNPTSEFSEFPCMSSISKPSKDSNGKNIMVEDNSDNGTHSLNLYPDGTFIVRETGERGTFECVDDDTMEYSHYIDYWWVKTNGSNLDVRQQNSTASPIVMKLKNRTKILVKFFLGYGNDSWYTYYDNNMKPIGYVAGRFLGPNPK